jgi:hypothetical protein
MMEPVGRAVWNKEPPTNERKRPAIAKEDGDPIPKLMSGLFWISK